MKAIVKFGTAIIVLTVLSGLLPSSTAQAATVRLTVTKAAPGNSLAFGYDPHGRLTSRKQTIGATTLTLTQRYNADGQLDQSTTPGGNTIGYLWQDGRIAAVTVNNAAVIDQISYEPDGQVAGWAWGNGQVSERFYDLNGRPVLVNLGFDTLGWGPATRGYSYDTAGRVTAIIDDTDPALGASYAYDGLGRLIGSELGGRTHDYTYDLSGNRTGKVVDGAAGHLIGDGAFTYGYDGQGWRTSASYAYNGLGQRVKKTVNGQTTLYFYDGQGHLLGEYNAAGQLIQETLWLGDLPIAVIKPAAQSPLVNVYYVHADHLGAPRAVTRPADNKTLWAWEGEAFGNTLANNNPSGLGNFSFNLRFPGQVYDPETGLYYNYFRDYDPANGRYIQSDPIGLAGGINTYSYVNGNPVNFTDPRGLNPFAGAAAGGELGAIGGPYGVVVGAILGGIAGEVAVEAIIDAIVDPYRNEIPIKDLDPLHPPETIGNRPDLGELTDEELLDSVRNPANGDKLTINTKTGKLVDGNSRARELTRRSKNPNSCITPDTTVPVDPYTPNDSMFLD